MRQFAIEKLRTVYEWAKQWDERLCDGNTIEHMGSNESFDGKVYHQLLQVAEPVLKRLRLVQAYIDKHSTNTEHGDTIKRMLMQGDDDSSSMLTVFEVQFETQKQLDDLRLSVSRNTEQNNTQQTQNPPAEAAATQQQQSTAPHVTVTRTKELVGKQLLDGLAGLQKGQNNGDFLYSYIGDKEAVEMYKECFKPKHHEASVLHSDDADTDAPTQEAQVTAAATAAPSDNAGTTKVQALLDELGCKRSGKRFSTRTAAFGVETNTTALSLGSIARSLAQPVAQLDASVLEDSLRIDNSSLEWLIDTKGKVDSRHRIVIKHTNGTFETVEEHQSNDDEVSPDINACAP